MVGSVHEQSNQELLEDQMKCIVAEIEIGKEQIAKKKRTQHRFPIYNKEPTREHLLLCKIHDAAAKWETEMRAKYMEGQVAKVVGRIMENVNNNTEFPSGSEPYHNWTKELMHHAKTGWYKYKKLMETVKKYPMQNLEQVCRHGEWILYDRSRSGASKRMKKKIEA
eukprot:CAMPEP_0118696790 /NCGR_PEP_ID=MMETSP0800-20121206/14073_1 /TAXON_ID=210618 ORGANISM="Striatella unipunctata, Strain CCMP2910" /NCGR_SAMPLE_ID=MMETSP0800 /ASSEMBLY_ACC=CAM_ASM_000638 /LENGTH=165 /DNA_ID=CAMNT_0006596003 /DNA_START=177 /DNA_END=674 /DNA_ORIENTATION=+